MRLIKSGVLFCALIAGGSVLAQGWSGSGKGGGGLSHEKKQLDYSGCEEGRQSIFTETGPDGDGSVTVFRTCHNGSYYDLSDYIYDPRPPKRRK